MIMVVTEEEQELILAHRITQAVKSGFELGLMEAYSLCLALADNADETPARNAFSEAADQIINIKFNP